MSGPESLPLGQDGAGRAGGRASPMPPPQPPQTARLKRRLPITRALWASRYCKVRGVGARRTSLGGRLSQRHPLWQAAQLSKDFHLASASFSTAPSPFLSLSYLLTEGSCSQSPSASVCHTTRPPALSLSLSLSHIQTHKHTDLHTCSNKKKKQIKSLLNYN